MPRLPLVLIAALALSACVENAAPVQRTGDGQAAKLKPGMSENDGFLIFGPESGFERNPANWDQSCMSYSYGTGEDPRYVHALFESGVLVSATDGHTALCTFGGLDPAEG